MDILGLNRVTSTQPKVSLEKEVDQYLSNPNSGSGMLAFWQVINVLSAICFFAKFIQEHEHQYPRIFKLAMDIIPIQASSVPCERVFSSGKETMALRRRRITANLMEALQMLKYSIKKGRPLNFTQGMRWAEELTEFEFAARTERVGDAEAYGRSLGEPEMDQDAIDEDLEDLQKDLEALEQQLLGDSDDEEEEDEEEDEEDADEDEDEDEEEEGEDDE